MQFGLKNFDMVFVFRDFHRQPTHVNTIPVESLESVKEWLDSCNIQYSEGPQPQLGHHHEDRHRGPAPVLRRRGWSFLATESDDEDQSESEEESAFEISGSELAASEESSEDESDFDDDASADASADGSLDEESAGEDWDELEKKAKKKDRESGLVDEEETSKKRKR